MEPRIDPSWNPEREMKALSRRSFLWAGVATLSTLGGLRWLVTRRTEEGIVWPLRRGLEFTDDFTGDLLQRNTPEFKDQPVGPPKQNGDIGQASVSREDFELTLGGVSDKDLTIEMGEILKLPKMVMTTELHCIEGWSNTVQWGGTSLAGFLAKHPPRDADGQPIAQTAEDHPKYLQMETDDGEYFVGLDMQSALHPQTMLCYEMNGKELPVDHGGPLRLVIPVKYGIKNIKWLASITYSQSKTKDYWADEGYDWFGGL